MSQELWEKQAASRVQKPEPAKKSTGQKSTGQKSTGQKKVGN